MATVISLKHTVYATLATNCT